MRDELIVADGLGVAYPIGDVDVSVVDGVSLSIRRGERVAIVGESGSGKSTAAMALLGLVPPPGACRGSIRYRGDTEIVGASERTLVNLRGSEIGFVPQNAAAALSPLRTIGSQLMEALSMHTDLDRKAQREKAEELLAEVHLSDPELRMKQYGHEISGGMAQRAMIAAAIAPQPALLIADEPTSALDATTATGVLNLLRELSAQRSMAVLMITHDLGAVARFAERVVVMYAGAIVEQGPVDAVFADPRHPYTRGLLASMPGVSTNAGGISGVAPSPSDRPGGCSFHPRCSLAQRRPKCSTERPVLVESGLPGAAGTACHFHAELGTFTLKPAPVKRDSVRQEDGPAENPLLRVTDLRKVFPGRLRGLRRAKPAIAVDGVSFDIVAGEAVALVGESGSGKTTTARMVLGLETPTSGSITFEGRDITDGERRPMDIHRHLQVVFQNPDSSLNPRMRVSDIVAEPLVIHGIGGAAERTKRVSEVLELVGLSTEHAKRYPFEFSGGQRQRIAIARALICRPHLIVMDEPVTALDVSVQAQILALLHSIRHELSTAFLFVAHDLAVVREFADRIAVMYRGELVEVAAADRFFAGPTHPYSASLLAAAGLDAEQPISSEVAQ